MTVRCGARAAVALAAGLLFTSSSASAGDFRFANEVISFNAGMGGANGYDNPLVTLGSPERFTGEGIFPGVVSPFNPAWGTNEILSLGAGGHITVRFDAPIVDSPNNPYGIDFIIFSNTGFIDDNFPQGIVGGLFGDDGGIIEVSANGVDWVEVSGMGANALFPTMGYLDSGPYDDTAGSIETDFTRPLNPALTMSDFLGQDYDGVRALYDGSGGGTGIDLAGTGLSSISFIRISNPGGATLNVEIDAFARTTPIPGPATVALLPYVALVFRRRRRNG